MNFKSVMEAQMWYKGVQYGKDFNIYAKKHTVQF